MIKFPYGIASFLKIREENFLYMDRTSYIRSYIVVAVGFERLLGEQQQ